MRAAVEKKAAEIRVLDIRLVASYADYLVLCNGSNRRQIQSIADEVLVAMKRHGDPAISVEGIDTAEWVLIDFGDMVVHIFSPTARSYYDFDRLYRDAVQEPLNAR